MDLKRGIDKAVEVVLTELAKLSKPIKDKKEISQVGTISANNDTKVGEMIAEAMEKVGKDGVITVEESKSTADSLEEPLRQIAINAGREGAVVVDAVRKGKGAYGFNADTDAYGDMVEFGIVDPTKVPRLQLPTGSRMAGLLR